MKNYVTKYSVLNKAITFQNVLYKGTFCNQLDLTKVKCCTILRSFIKNHNVV